MGKPSEWTPEAEGLFQRLLFDLYDPIQQAERTLRLAEQEAARTDPWRWYCRICGTEGQANTEEERDRDGFGHVDACPKGRWDNVGTESIGRLRHVWSWGPVNQTVMMQLMRRLYEEIARLAGAEDPKARVEQVLAEFDQRISPEATEELIRRLEAP